jgi:hypothetical protein
LSPTGHLLSRLAPSRLIRRVLTKIAKQAFSGEKRIYVDLVNVRVVCQVSAKELYVEVFLEKLDEHTLNACPDGVGLVLGLIQLGGVHNELAIVFGAYFELLEGQVDQLHEELGVVLDGRPIAALVSLAAVELGVVDQIGLEHMCRGCVYHDDELVGHFSVDFADELVDNVYVGL